jgi:hypothetical protein
MYSGEHINVLTRNYLTWFTVVLILVAETGL